MTAAIYTQRVKARHFTEAMVKGFPAVERPSANEILDEKADLHILGGLQFGCLELMLKIRARGKAYVFWDNAYLGGGTSTDRLRITANGYQKTLVDRGRSLERFERFGGRIQPWRRGGEHILVVPPGEAIRRLFGLGDWLSDVQRRLARVTDREVDVSVKGDKRPLEARLKGCHAVVTWSSNVAVEAVLAGVPAFVSKVSAAYPVAEWLGALESLIETPGEPDRAQWAASLAWGQFTVREIESGFAREVVLGGAK